ncbi:hyalin-like [Amphiura filiformis]|uniref:hyalin-like n=1 Tax=Amphiura filiformis TaxID=82378 RepID=UPI003B20DB7F
MSSLYDADGITAYTAYTGCAADTFQCYDDAMTCISEADICNLDSDGTNPTSGCDGGEDEVGCGMASCEGCPADIMATEGEIVSWVPPTTTSSAYELISDPNCFPYTTFPVGSTDVTYRIFGPSPFHYCRFTVTVTAPATPAIDIGSCPNKNQIKTADVGAETAMVSWTEPGTTTGVTTINNEAYRPNSEFPIGYTRVVYTLTDSTTGDVSYCAFYVHVIGNPDAVGPSIDCIAPVVITVNPPATNASAQEQLDALLASAVDATSTTTSHPTNYLFPLGTTPFHVSLIDSNGNSHSACQTDITVQYPFDDTPPVIANCPSGVTVCYATGATVAQGAWTKPTAEDMYLKSFTSNIIPNNFLEIPTTAPFTTTVTYTATDWNDNVATCEFDLSFEVDTLPPVLTNCNNYTEYTTQTSGTIVANYQEPSVSDNCGEWQVTVAPDSNNVFSVESIQRLTYTATDNAGNSASCDFTVEVRIDQLPEFVNCPTSWTVTTDPGTTTAEVSWNAPQPIDDNQLNPDNVEVTITPLPGIILDPTEDQTITLENGVYTVVYSYTDVNLQTRECPFTITVQDSEAPVFGTCPNDIERTLNAEDDTIEVEWDSPTAVDNDGGEVQIQIQSREINEVLEC